MSDPTKLGFLSLEFIAGDDTYWLTTGLGRDGFYFTVLPRGLFGDATLLPMFISRETDYSEITPFPGLNAFQSSQSDGVIPLEVDLVAASRLSWNETAARLMDAIPLADQSGLWHNHVVRKADPALAISDVNYLVTAFLPPPDGEGVLAVRGEDWAIGTNPNWITMMLPTEGEFKARLRQFTVVAMQTQGQFYPV